MSRHQNARQNHYIKVPNKSIENVAKLKYMEMTITNQYVIAFTKKLRADYVREMLATTLSQNRFDSLLTGKD
jgi:hypothetical protein